MEGARKKMDRKSEREKGSREKEREGERERQSLSRNLVRTSRDSRCEAFSLPLSLVLRRLVNGKRLEIFTSIVKSRIIINI